MIEMNATETLFTERRPCDTPHWETAIFRTPSGVEGIVAMEDGKIVRAVPTNNPHAEWSIWEELPGLEKL